MVLVAKRTVMSLFSDEQDIYNHQVRVVLAEKGVNVEIYPVSPNNIPEDLLEINPYGSVPTLVDHELVLYDSRVIMEYLDERFPHPPLLPVYPIVRAETRKMMYRIERDWYSLMHQIEGNGNQQAAKGRVLLRDSLTNIAPVFADKPYFLSAEFSMLDCCLAPLLWRLPQLGVELPNSAKAIIEYGQRMFERDSFQTSLTEMERELYAA